MAIILNQAVRIAGAVVAAGETVRNYSPDIEGDLVSRGVASYAPSSVKTSALRLSEALQDSLNQGGLVSFTQPGTYVFQTGYTYSTNQPVELYVAPGVHLIDEAGNYLQAPGTTRQFWVAHVGKYGAMGDGRVSTNDASCTNGSNLVTSASLAFTQADIGKRLVVTDPSNTNAFGSRISSVDSNGRAVCASNSGVTIAAGYCVVGTDNYQAIQNALNATAAVGGSVKLGRGIYVVGNAAAIVIPGGVTLRGVGHDFGTVQRPAERGSVIINTFPKTAFGNYVIDLGDDAVAFIPGETVPRLFDVAVDAANLAYAPVRTIARRSRVYLCQLWRGAGSAARLEGQNTEFRQNIAGQTNAGDVVQIRNADIKIQQNELRQHGTGHTINLLNSPNCLIQGNHMYAGFNGVIASTEPGNNIYAETADAVTDILSIIGNSFDATYGAHIKIKTTRTTGSVRYGVISIAGNNFFQVSGFPDATFPVVELDIAASSSCRALTMNGNTGLTGAGLGGAYTAIVGYTGSGTVAHCSVANNTFLNCNEVFAGFTPDAGISGNVIAPGTSTTVERSSNQGRSTQSGNAALTVFNIAHGLSAIPAFCNVGPSTAAAQAAHTVTADATNIIVTFAAAPPNAANNLVWNWTATI